MSSGTLRGTSAPRTASPPLRIPASRSTSAGKCPRCRRRHLRSGPPWKSGKKSPPHILPVQVQPLETLLQASPAPRAHLPPSMTSPTPSPSSCELLHIWRASTPLPNGSVIMLTHSFNKYLLLTCLPWARRSSSAGWRSLQPQARRPAL